jgi:hypothetical protein
MAITLRKLRSGRATMLPQSICRREKVPSKVSFIGKAEHLTVPSAFRSGQNVEPVGCWLAEARVMPNSTKNISARLSFQHTC